MLLSVAGDWLAAWPETCRLSELWLSDGAVVGSLLVAGAEALWSGSAVWLGSSVGSLEASEGAVLGSAEVLSAGTVLGLLVPPERPSLTWVIVVP